MRDLQELQALIRDFLKDIKPFSGETLILLSLFSWIMSLLISTEIMKDLLARLGWVFLTLGIGWVMSKVKYTILGVTIYPSPWITGALTCAFIFEGFGVDASVVLTSWPLISAVIATTPKFIKHGLDLVNPTIPDAEKLASDRQEIVKLFLLSSIFSCWFQFHFLVQDWLRDYPSLMADSFNRSAFVLKVDSNEPPAARGMAMLSLAEYIINDQLEQSSWAETERWLLNAENEIERVRAGVLARIPDAEEDALWDLNAQVLPGNPDYRLQLAAVWRGPSSIPNGYFLRKMCAVTQVASSAIANPENAPSAAPRLQSATQVACDQTVDKIWFQRPEAAPV